MRFYQLLLVLDSFGLLLGLGFLSEELLLDVFFELDPLALQRKSKLACVLNFRGFGAVILVISGAVALSRLAFLEIIRNIGCLLISVILLVFIGFRGVEVHHFGCAVYSFRCCNTFVEVCLPLLVLLQQRDYMRLHKG